MPLSTFTFENAFKILIDTGPDNLLTSALNVVASLSYTEAIGMLSRLPSK